MAGTHVAAPTRAADRPRDAILAAFLELLATAHHRDVTVTQIASRAGVSRRTFYRAFATKADVVTACTEQLVDDYVEHVRPVVDGSMRTVLVAHFAFWSERRTTLDLLRRGGLLGTVLEAYDRRVAEVAHRAGSTRYDEVPRREYALSLTAGAYASLLLAWLRRGARETPEQLADAVLGPGGDVPDVLAYLGRQA